MLPHALLALLCAGTPSWSDVELGGKTVSLHPKCQALATSLIGPFVKLGDGRVLVVAGNRVMVSKDDLQTWSDHPLFAQPQERRLLAERALMRTRDGTLILAFNSAPEKDCHGDGAQGGLLAKYRLPVYITRSTDDGKTWREPKLLQDGNCGALLSLIQLRHGRLVLGCQAVVTDSGRHVCYGYVSDDEGQTWKQSNVIDLGAHSGCGGHGGGAENTMVQLGDGRVWMLVRTFRGCLIEAFSEDQGLTWQDFQRSKIEARGSLGQIRRLQSGRLVLFWNRFVETARRTGRRQQLSMTFSEDEGRTWTEPVVVAYSRLAPGAKEPDCRLAYSYVYEHVPGEIWVTTTPGPLRIKLLEDDFLPRRLSDKTYAVRYLPTAEIQLDGRDDDPAWSLAAVEEDFAFPWREVAAPRTEFRALCDDRFLYFAFRVEDEDIFVLDTFRDEGDAVFEDRAEMYFSRNDRMHDYFCIEVDSRGRAFDYRGAYYRQLEPTWNWAGLDTTGSPNPKGYVVEGRISLASFDAMGFPRLRPGVKIRCGLYRAEFSHDRSGRPVAQRQSIHNLGRRLDGPPPIETWMSWVDPNTQEPDFHVPTSLGWLEIVE